MDPTVIVLVSFIIFMGMAYRLGYHQSMAALDSKIAGIRQALDEAAQAKEAAVQALNQERRLHGEIQEEIELITKRAEEQALNLRHQSLQDINKIISARQQATENMIERMRHTAIQTIREEAAAATLATFEELVMTKFSSLQQEALNERSLAQITTQLTKSHMAYAPKPKRTKPKRSAAV